MRLGSCIPGNPLRLECLDAGAGPESTFWRFDKSSFVPAGWAFTSPHYVHSRRGPFSRFQLVPSQPG